MFKRYPTTSDTERKARLDPLCPCCSADDAIKQRKIDNRTGKNQRQTFDEYQRDAYGR